MNRPDESQIETKSRLLLYVGVTAVVGALLGLNGHGPTFAGAEALHDGYAVKDGYRLAVHVE